MISCDCSCDYEGETMQFSTETIRKARKEHTCCECREKIKPGDKYEFVSGLWDGSFGSFKTCLRCLGIRKTLCSNGWIYGELKQQVWDGCGMDYLTGEISEWLREDMAKRHVAGAYLPSGMIRELQPEIQELKELNP